MDQMRPLYEFSSYKNIMLKRLTGAGNRGQLSRASEHLKCQASFLSRVMNSEVHLTPDQAFMLTEFWRLGASETEFFRCLVEYERASEPKLKAHIKAKITELKKEHESLQNRIGKSDFSVSNQQATYFSSWLWSAIHFLVSIPHYQSIPSIASRIGLNEISTKHYLELLSHMGLIQNNGNRWSYKTGQFHIPKSSPFVSLHHQNWRSRAVIDSQNPDSDGIHYTSVLTLSHDDLEQIKELLLQFISKSDAIAKPSEPKELVILTCDLFRV